VRFLSHKITLAVSLTAVLVLSPMPARAFDPTGFLVNKLMEFLIDEATRPPKQPVNDFPVSNRSIPKESKSGTLEPPRNGNQLEIDGDDYILAFNSRIRDEGNRIVHTGMIQQEKRIRYTQNNQEQVDKIWLLAPNEK
jgi:hypothetical protein